MTDRHAGYLVILEHDIREDDAERIIDAMYMIKGVLKVEPHIGDIAHAVERERIRNEYWVKIREVFYPKQG